MVILTDIIDKSYSLFASYHLTRPLDICTDCCMSPDDEATLARLPVRQIPRDLLAAYNDGAKPDKTRIEEVKHFLPRYLDLLVQFEFPTHSAELSFSRLTPFDKAQWTKDELELLNDFSIEYFKHCLSIYPLPSFNDEIDTILIMFGKADFNIDDLLTIWENTNTKESMLHFRDLYFYGFDPYNHTKLSSPFDDKKLEVTLRTWLETEKVNQCFADTIEQLIIGDNDLDTLDIDQLSLLYDIIRTKGNSL